MGNKVVTVVFLSNDEVSQFNLNNAVKLGYYCQCLEIVTSAACKTAWKTNPFYGEKIFAIAKHLLIKIVSFFCSMWWRILDRIGLYA